MGQPAGSPRRDLLGGCHRRSAGADWSRFLAGQDPRWERPFLGNGNEWGVARLPIGRVLLTPVGELTCAWLRLDLWNAELTGTVTTGKDTRAFVHSSRDLFLVDVAPSAGERGFGLTFAVSRASSASSQGRHHRGRPAARRRRAERDGVPGAPGRADHRRRCRNSCSPTAARARRTTSSARRSRCPPGSTPPSICSAPPTPLKVSYVDGSADVPSGSPDGVRRRRPARARPPPRINCTHGPGSSP